MEGAGFRSRRAATRRLLVFGRLPEPGRAKTRLIPVLGPEGAAALYGAFLEDLLARAPAIAPTELWVPDRPGARERLGPRFSGTAIRIQPDGDLGARLVTAFERAFADRVDHVVALGSDHPTLPVRYVERVFSALHGAHLALGPTHDGGYWAIGLRRLCWPSARGLFEAAPWSTPDLLAWTRRRAVELDLCHVELPHWYDVDEPEDLERLARDVSPESETGRVWRTLARGEGRGASGSACEGSPA